MDIKHKQESNKGAFEAYMNDVKAGEMTYSRAGESMIIIDHTDVEEAYKGKGVGKALVMEAVKFARANQIKIMPLCPFANSVFKKNDELKDVLR